MLTSEPEGGGEGCETLARRRLGRSKRGKETASWDAESGRPGRARGRDREGRPAAESLGRVRGKGRCAQSGWGWEGGPARGSFSSQRGESLVEGMPTS